MEKEQKLLDGIFTPNISNLFKLKKEINMRAVIVTPDQVSSNEVFKSDFKEFNWDGSIESLCLALGVQTQYEINGNEKVTPIRLIIEKDTCYVETEYDTESMYLYHGKVLGNQTRVFVGLRHLMENIEVSSKKELMNQIVFSREEHIQTSTDKIHAIWNGTSDELEDI